MFIVNQDAFMTRLFSTWLAKQDEAHALVLTLTLISESGPRNLCSPYPSAKALHDFWCVE